MYHLGLLQAILDGMIATRDSRMKQEAHIKCKAERAKPKRKIHAELLCDLAPVPREGGFFSDLHNT